MANTEKKVTRKEMLEAIKEVVLATNTIDYFRTERIFLQCAGVVLVTALLLWIKSGAHFNIGVSTR